MGLLTNFTQCVGTHVCPCVIILYTCVVHTVSTCVCLNRCTCFVLSVCGLCLSGRVKASGGLFWYPLSLHSSLPSSAFLSLLLSLSPFLSLLSSLRRSFSWFDLKQNSIPQFHTLSAVDKGPACCSRAPERDRVCPQNGRKSNSSRQWGPFVELSRMKGPYLASHCFSQHLPVSHCRPEQNKSLFKRKKSCKKVFWSH